MVAEKRTRGGERSEVRRGQTWESRSVDVRMGGKWHGRKAVIFSCEAVLEWMIQSKMLTLTSKVRGEGENGEHAEDICS